MTPERWKQVDEVFNAVLDHPQNERSAFLRAACHNDSVLQAQVEYLLDCHQHADDFIEGNAITALNWVTADEAITWQMDTMIGRRVGVYKLVRELGRGGMGTVYLATRADGEFQQQVAIKLIKRGMDTDFILRRFCNERQILAALDHPNIARLHDGGTTEDGLPYFVMEYIEGLPLHCYCDAKRLSITARLQLFQQVCSAVAHAHKHKIIHRDIKPGNILVMPSMDGKAGTLKLLDFGIAKLLNPELAFDTIDRTMSAMRLMTPEYASPEQARGEPVTAATDQYSLGVVLYELLTGQRPHHLHHRPLHEMTRIISEEEPEKPSIVVTRTREITASDGRRSITLTPEAVSHERSSSPDELWRKLAGRLDNIVMQALRKDPHERYDSVQALSQDLDQYLQGLPVIAPAHVLKREPIVAAAQPIRWCAVKKAIIHIAIPKPVAWKMLAGSALVVALLAIATIFVYIKRSNFFFVRLGPHAKQTDVTAILRPPRRLTNNLVKDSSPKVSPDGKTMVFVSDRSGTMELYQVNLDGTGYKVLTDNTAHEATPAWSPDGKRIVFAIETLPLRESDIWIMDSDGRNAINLTKAPGHDARPVFSPDGKRIAFASNRDNSFIYNFDIWVMNADGSNVHRLTNYEEYEADPTWSPDSQRIAFTRAMHNKIFDILVMHADGSNIVNLTNSDDYEEALPTWSPDGKRIAFASNRGSQNKNYNLWLMSSDGTNRRLAVLPLGHNTEPAWTPDSRHLVFESTRDFNPELYLAEVAKD